MLMSVQECEQMLSLLAMRNMLAELAEGDIEASYIQKQSAFSRRKVFDLLKEGKVLLNGNKCDNFSKEIHPVMDIVKVDGQQLKHSSKKYYYLFNKPKNVISTVSDPKGRKNLEGGGGCRALILFINDVRKICCLNSVEYSSIL